MTRRRWDIDERGRGTASGHAFASQLAELEHEMHDPGRIAEDPSAPASAPGSRVRRARILIPARHRTIRGGDLRRRARRPEPEDAGRSAFAHGLTAMLAGFAALTLVLPWSLKG